MVHVMGGTQWYILYSVHIPTSEAELEVQLKFEHDLSIAHLDTAKGKKCPPLELCLYGIRELASATSSFQPIRAKPGRTWTNKSRGAL